MFVSSPNIVIGAAFSALSFLTYAYLLCDYSMLLRNWAIGDVSPTGEIDYYQLIFFCLGDRIEDLAVIENFSRSTAGSKPVLIAIDYRLSCSFGLFIDWTGRVILFGDLELND